MRVRFLNDRQMIHEFGMLYEGQPSCVLGIFGYENGERSIYILNNLSAKGKICVLLHEMGHCIFSYFTSIHKILDKIWDIKMDKFWESITKYFY